MELIGPIIDVLSCLGDPACRYIGHHRKLEERMNYLQTRVDHLNTLKRDTELRIKAELRWGKILREEVEKWLLDIQGVNDEMRVINQRLQHVSCFTRARLGKLVSLTVQQVEKIIEQGAFTDSLVIDKPSDAGIPFQLGHLEGETVVKAEIWNYLMGDETGMVGVCGMGGIGKTTIMKHIHNQLLKESKALFEKLIWVTVSKEINIPNLQQEIAKAFGIVALPELEQERVAVLMDELGKKKFVLILDDVWKKFSLSEVGIPIPTSSCGSKLVLTSRSIEECRSMDCKIVKVKPLSNKESMNLFLKHVGREVLDVPSLKEVLGHIVKECDGLPLAIVVIAGSMKGTFDVREWRNALRELREHVRSVKNADEEIYERLKFSFDRLRDQKIQNCFLYCSLYPEDYVIPRMELIEYWIDEGFLGTGSREEMYDWGHTILNRLENNCLLEKDGKGDNVKMHDVMRDTALYIKDRNRFMVKAGIGLYEFPNNQEWAEDLERVSLMMNSIRKFPPDLSPICANLSTLLLQKNKFRYGIPESFFLHMPGLCILDLSYSDIEQLPDSVSNLEKLKSLVLHQCCWLRYVPSLEKLKALRKLDLCNTAIEKVPDGLEMLANLTYLNLFTESLKELPIAIVPKLSCLQYLVLYVESSTLKTRGLESVTRLTKLETFEGRFNELVDFNTYCRSSQVQGLSSYLLVMAPLEAKFELKQVHPPKMSRFVFKLNGNKEIYRKNLFKLLSRIEGLESGILDGEAKLTVVGCVESSTVLTTLAKCGSEAVLLKHPIPCCLPQKEVVLNGCHIGREDTVAFPSNLRSLRIYEFHNLRSLSHISFFQQTNELETCSIHGCRGMESVVELWSSSSPCNPLQNLELLHLEKLDNLHTLVKVVEREACLVSTSSSLITADIFSQLKSFHIEACSNMKQLFPFECGNGLQNLENLVVDNCVQMEEIVASEGEGENRKGKGTCSPTTTFSFPKLRVLRLVKLPALKSICGSNMVMTCDSLRCIEIYDCPGLKRMPLLLPIFEDSSHPFERISCSKKWWKSVEWYHPNAKNVLQPWWRH
ncbi:hypothetical protein HRI_004808400 [Hibiscus trionum]|uniref:NB-ARC domain-containing protein n=1 Tax=Hibiscus trionum TaxID=183268 RepID=A0A9W7JAI6_HIBTR|nr:hypothetical protein HRI_004808400 [Hibiscus trionum]